MATLDEENGDSVDYGIVHAKFDPDTEDCPERASGLEMDEQRQKNIAYEYLCRLEEAKVWIEACINEKLPETTEIEESLTNGVYLAKLAHFFSPQTVSLKKIYDKDQRNYQTKGLHFRHTDNINHWLRALEVIGLPKTFYPETTDIYDRKNMPKVIYCIHALSLFLFKLGIAPQIENLYGKVNFTDEQISAMRKELDKYGIQMPAFSKIGGILANEMPVDEAALHAAIIAINDAVELQDSVKTLAALQNPAAHLTGLVPMNQSMYQQALHQAKQAKQQSAANKSFREGETIENRDVYDTFLTQAEIQGNLNKVNMKVYLEKINSAVDSKDAERLMELLADAKFQKVKSTNQSWYLEELDKVKHNKREIHGGPLPLEKEDVQAGIELANSNSEKKIRTDAALNSINSAIDKGNPDETYKTLISPDAALPTVYPEGAPLYQTELANLKNSKDGNDLSHEELIAAVTLLSGVWLVNRAVEAGSATETFKALSHPDVAIDDLDQSSQQRYQDALYKAKVDIEILSHVEIQECVRMINEEVQEEHERMLAVQEINEAVEQKDPAGTLAALQLKTAKLTDVSSDLVQAVHYQDVLARQKLKKAQRSEDPSSVLWLDEIQEAVLAANSHAEEANKLGVAMASINLMVQDGNAGGLLSNLRSPDVFISSITPECADQYLQQLQDLRKSKAAKNKVNRDQPWVKHKTREGYEFYYNSQALQLSWQEPEGFEPISDKLTREEVQAVVSRVTSDHDRQLFFHTNEDKIVQLQASFRGALARKAYRNRMDFINRQLPAIIRIQSWVRGIRQKRQYLERLNYLNDQLDPTILLQSYVRMWRDRKRYQQQMKYYTDHRPDIVKIQAWFRSNKARNDYHTLIHSDNPPLSVVRKFAHLLDSSDNDFDEELELQKLRQQVVQEIRANQTLENDLNVMDIKIGLLVKNRLTIQDVVSHGKNLSRKRADTIVNKGIKALSKDKRQKLESYQHLFYLLQTNPHYLAKLIFAMPQSRTTKFMESVILTLYNYAANQREEYLLLKLFTTALEEEISSKVDRIMDIVTGNPMVVKMVVHFNRGAKGQSSLRELLQPLVQEVLDNKSLDITTNPVEVYKAWINQTETETGETSTLPYEVTREQALSHQVVNERLQESVASLRRATDTFLNTILAAHQNIPYGMRYMAKVLKTSLSSKFEDAKEDDILKIVGNLIYYRYINPAIVAPEAFDIIDLGAEKMLSNLQRKNLGAIAKVLQFAASNKLFEGENSHLESLNDYISEAYAKFRNYFIAACNVSEPEENFNMNEYSDFATLHKPLIYISAKEICDTHTLLLEHLDALSSDPKDPLNELLDDLGDSPPSITDLIGELPGDPNDPSTQLQIATLSKQEISLTLTNKFEIHEDDDTNMKNLFIRTKHMVVDVIRSQPGETILEILGKISTDEQEEQHQDLIQKRIDQDAKAKKGGKLKRTLSSANENRLPLESMKKKIERNLRMLESAGLVTLASDYQEIINTIAKDILNQRRYRQRRKQEIVKLSKTTSGLESKAKFYEEQIDYYNQYIKKCLDNLQRKKSSKGKSGGDFKEKSTVKYTAAKLHEKGVLLEIDEMSENQFKNVMFEISPTELSGVFKISAKFLGVTAEKVELVFQDLLQLQYEGVAVLKMFGKAKVNVNLLIFLLNKKFYGRYNK